MEIELNPNWASSLSYDFLDHPDERKPIFVGRQHLLDPLVADIVHPEKSGAYLISGYRGSGKTTLLIEALWRAQQRSKKAGSAERQFVVVLNVSEVSASLESGAERSADPITIDPRRLLIALLRSLTNRVRSYESNGNKLAPQLKARISETYNKAMAASYTQASSARREQEESRLVKSASELSATAPYKLGGALAALAALGIEAVTWESLRSGFGHVLAGAAAATAAWSWSKSWTMSKNLRNTRSSETTLRFDNSLQQLENDLKDILQLLYKEDIRTIVVLEELDKIDDAGGTQLDRVIRYFKNLFTQAPALFFFLADKSYFDLVESRIRKARSRRYYALEHTFFTHRLYVGRPNLQDSLDYLREASVDPHYKKLVGDLYAGDSASALSQEGERFSRFVRTLLFRSANHLFDLKNELRRYVRGVDSATGRVALVVDDRSFPEDEAALSVFQDLVESKTRAYAFGRGRTYANEALQDYLYGVFQDMGSTRPQYIGSFYPRASQEVEVTPENCAAPQTTTVESPLEWDEIQRISDAVDSLVTDLSRGGAFASFGNNAFVWRKNPARTFHLERQLEKHEIDLLREVRRLIAELDSVSSGTPFKQRIPDANFLLSELRKKERTIQDAQTSVPVEVADAEKEQFQSRVERAIADLYRVYLDEVRSQYGFGFEQVCYGPGGEGVYRLLQQTQFSESQTSGARPGEFEVLVILGSLDSFAGALVPASQPLKRASIIQAVRGPVSPRQRTAREVWQYLHPPTPLPTEGEEREFEAPQRAEVAVSLDFLPLDEGLSQRSSNPEWQAWGQLLGDTILFRAYWATCWVEPLRENPHVRVARLENGVETEVTRSTLIDAAAAWVQQDAREGDEVNGASRLLWIATPPSGGNAEESRMLPRDALVQDLQKWYELLWAAFGQPLFLDVAAAHTHLLGPFGRLFEAVEKQILSGANPAGMSAAAPERLLQRGRLICLSLADPADTEGRRPKEIRQIVGARGRAVYIGETLPEEFRRLGVTRVELP
jgi:hypothetical protein